MRPIDADALIKEIWIIRGSLQMLDNTQGADLIMHGLWMVEQKINEAPTIEPKRGEWKKVKNIHVWDISGIETWGVERKCTNCDFRHTFIEDHGHYNFCPNCGARMKGADDETD